LNYRRRNRTNYSFAHNYSNKSTQNVKEPFYEEVDLTHKENALDFAQNVAYQSTLKK